MPFASEDHFPPLEPIAACGAKTTNVMLPIARGPSAHDDAEIILASRAGSGEILSHYDLRSDAGHARVVVCHGYFLPPLIASDP